jgi:hypothetical protein
MNRFLALTMGVFLITSVSMAQNSASVSEKTNKTVASKDSAATKSQPMASSVKNDKKAPTDKATKSASVASGTSVSTKDALKTGSKDTLKTSPALDSLSVKIDSMSMTENQIDTMQSAGAQRLDSTVTFSVTLKTDPDSVAILMNDSLKGLSPLVLTGLKTGEYSFILKKKGYYQKKVTALIDSQSVKELMITLQQPGNLTITSDPSGATVTFNGEAKGVAPVTITTIKPGDYTVNLTKEKYLPFEKNVIIASGKTDTLMCKMVLDTAVINAEKRANAKQKRDKSKTTSLILGIAFVLFAGIITIIDFSGNK